MNSPNTITVTRVQDIHQFENLREEWTTLLFQCTEPDVFLTWEWLFAWWKNLGQANHQLWILLFHEDNKLIGIAPLTLGEKKRFSIGFRWLGNLGDPDCDIGGIIALDPQKIMQALLNYLSENKHEWDVFELMELNLLNEANQKILSVLDSSGCDVYRMNDKHFYIPLTEQTWEEYYKHLSKNMKHNLKRRLKRISEMGHVTFNKYTGASLTWQKFQTIFTVSEKSNFPDLYKTEQSRAFHQDLFELMQKQEWIQIETLSINERPIAFQYGFCFEGRYEDWRGGIDKDFETFAPGKLLMRFSLEDRFQCGITENDFLRGVYSYKMDWNPLYRVFANVQVYSKASIKSRLAYMWLQYVKPFLQKRGVRAKEDEPNDSNDKDG